MSDEYLRRPRLGLRIDLAAVIVMGVEMPDKRDQKAKYEYPIYGINWTGGIGRPAGIYWLDGRSVMAAHGSAAEDRLLDQGAILVGTLRFDGQLGEQYHAARSVRRVNALTLAMF
jgi:hypothetical protein